MIRKYFTLYVLILFVLACHKSNSDLPTTNIPSNPLFFKGADISWLTEMEFNGKKFYDTSGHPMELLSLLKSYGINTIRLRIWVHPTNGWNNMDDVLSKALRAKALGMHLMLDFHFSDSWADPGHQAKPTAWQNADFTDLKDSLRMHTIQVLKLMQANQISPDIVQIGNETNDGMLWPDGQASLHMNNFAQLIQCGYLAVKSIFPNTKVMIHLSNAYDNNLYRWLFDGLQNNGANWDVIGMSLYPDSSNWRLLNEQSQINMTDLINRYNKELMVVEVGMPWNQPDTCYLFLSDLLQKTKSLKDQYGLGIAYWEPQAYNWQSYGLGCFDTSGKPTLALNAFK